MNKQEVKYHVDAAMLNEYGACGEGSDDVLQGRSRVPVSEATVRRMYRGGKEWRMYWPAYRLYGMAPRYSSEEKRAAEIEDRLMVLSDATPTRSTVAEVVSLLNEVGDLFHKLNAEGRLRA